MSMVEKVEELVVVNGVVGEFNLDSLPDISFLNRKDPSTIQLKRKIQRFGRKYQKDLIAKDFSRSMECIEQLIVLLDHNQYNQYIVDAARKVLRPYVPMLISYLDGYLYGSKVHYYLRLITCRDHIPFVCVWNHHFSAEVEAYKKI